MSREPIEGPLLHLALPQDWEAAQAGGEYRVSTRGRTLQEEGFIHCSRAHQVETVRRAFYADVDPLLLLVIDPTRLTAPIVEEPPAPGVDELFPHIYGPLPVAAVTEVRTLHAPT